MMNETTKTSVAIIAQMGPQVLERTNHSIKVKMPLANNINHVGTMYAGSLFTLAEFPVGEFIVPKLDTTRAIFILGKASIKFIKPAMTDITADFHFDENIIERIYQDVETEGKFTMEHEQELFDEQGDLVAISKMRYVAIKPPKG